MAIDTTVTVEDVMATPVETIARDATISEVAEAMRENEINSLLVPGSEMGIVTSTDVLDAVAKGQDPTDTEVETVMTAPAESVEMSLGMEEVAAMLTTYDISHLPVRDHHGDYVGMVSSTDISELLAGSVVEQ
jgi:signal-transduction protein with cAMP-binding, CBS, and nucleotidyltransferase domain